MSTATENAQHMQVYSEKIRTADKRELPDVVSDIAEARDDGVITAEQYVFLMKLRSSLPQPCHA